jgi:hypothetical protein
MEFCSMSDSGDQFSRGRWKLGTTAAAAGSARCDSLGAHHDASTACAPPCRYHAGAAHYTPTVQCAAEYWQEGGQAGGGRESGRAHEETQSSADLAATRGGRESGRAHEETQSVPDLAALGVAALGVAGEDAAAE